MTLHVNPVIPYVKLVWTGSTVKPVGRQIHTTRSTPVVEFQASILVAPSFEKPVILHVKVVLVTEISDAQNAMKMRHWVTEDEVVTLDMVFLTQTHEIHVTQDVLNVLEPQKLNEPRVVLGI